LRNFGVNNRKTADGLSHHPQTYNHFIALHHQPQTLHAAAWRAGTKAILRLAKELATEKPLLPKQSKK